MFEKFLSLFRSLDKINEKNYNDFLDFYTAAVRDFPQLLKKRLAERKISPLDKAANLKEFHGWILDFTIKDILWWKNQWNLHTPVFKTLETIKAEIYDAALDLLESMPNSPETSKLYQELLDDIQKHWNPYIGT